MKRAKVKIVVPLVVVVVLVAIILGAYGYFNNLDLNPPQGSVTIEAFVTEIHAYPSGETWRMYVTYDDKYDGIICFDRSTRIYSVKGKKISGDEIKAGDNLEILIDGTVIYEPVDTFHNCYRIKVLPQETAVLKEVHVFSREDYWRKQIGTLSGEEAKVIIEAANKGEWFVKNEYRDNRLKLKVAGNILYYHPDEGAFYNAKKPEMMLLDSETKENVEMILRKYMELQEKEE